MGTGRLLVDDLLLPESPVDGRNSPDSSRLLLGLMTFARSVRDPDETGSADSQLHGIIDRGVLRGLLAALHFRDVATVRHVRRVAMICVGMAQHLGWDPPQRKVIEIAGLLHDIGKIGVPDNILFKPGALNPDEAELMALHHNIGIDVLQACRIGTEVLEIITQAHTDYETAGDQSRQTGPAMHQGARILSVADAYDSLSTDQVYRAAKTHPEILNILMDAAGTQFDGNVVCALSRWIENEGLPFAKRSATPTAAEQISGPGNPEDALQASSLGHIFSYLYVLESLYDGFYLLDSDLRFVVWNRGCERLTGVSAADRLGSVWTSSLLGYADESDCKLPEQDCPMNRVVEQGRPVTCNVRIQDVDGHSLPVELQTVPLLDRRGGLHGAAEILRDLSGSSRRPLELRKLKTAASRDPLTSVANRGELETQLSLLLTEFAGNSDAEPFSIMFLDVDHFKEINDTFGHTVGDRVLIEVSRLVRSETYSGELLGRYGGDEFVILCPGTDLEQAVHRAERLRNALFGARIEGMGEYCLMVSFGVTQVEAGDSVESILRRADKALYRAKATGRNRSCSLTSATLEHSGDLAEHPTLNPPEPFVCKTTFQAVIAADMIVYKLGGFVNDHHAELKEATPHRAIVQLGQRGLLPYWGKTDTKRPVELTIEFGNEPTASGLRRRTASKQVPIEVCIRPIGWIRDSQVFQERAKRAIKLLRSYFAAD